MYASSSVLLPPPILLFCINIFCYVDHFDIVICCGYRFNYIPRETQFLVESMSRDMHIYKLSFIYFLNILCLYNHTTSRHGLKLEFLILMVILLGVQRRLRALLSALRLQLPMMSLGMRINLNQLTFIYKWNTVPGKIFKDHTSMKSKLVKNPSFVYGSSPVLPPPPSSRYGKERLFRSIELLFFPLCKNLGF